MANYRIIGGDQKEYGPVSAEQLRAWIAEGRVAPQTPVRPEDSGEWKPLSAFPEFADVVAARFPVAGAPPPPRLGGLPADVFARDYNLDIIGCIDRAWKLLTNHFGAVVGGVALYLAIQLAIGALSNIPVFGVFVSLGSIVVAGPMLGGVYYYLLKIIRGQRTEVGEIFSGFRLAFLHLFLGYFIAALLTALSALPGGVLMGISIFLMVQQKAVTALYVVLAVLGFILAIVPVIYLGVSWAFTLPLVVDKQMDFWSAMGASRKMIAKHWWLMFGFFIICALTNFVGLLACCVGVFITVPLVFTAMMCAYENMFSGPAPQTA
jgi:hypothetical protein